MSMRWIECGRDKIVAQGRLPHRVWRIGSSASFGAESGLDIHPEIYQTAAEARRECERRDSEGQDNEVD